MELYYLQLPGRGVLGEPPSPKSLHDAGREPHDAIVAARDFAEWAQRLGSEASACDGCLEAPAEELDLTCGRQFRKRMALCDSCLRLWLGIVEEVMHLPYAISIPRDVGLYNVVLAVIVFTTCKAYQQAFPFSLSALLR